MSGHFWIDWLALAISLFNSLILVWLGLTVLLNAERRNWGVLLAVAGLLAGAGFFVSHSIVLSQGASALIRDFGFWWHVGWAPLIAAPFAWYLLMLWYSGFWDTDGRGLELRHRQAGWLWACLVYALLLGGVLLVANPLPSLAHESYIEVERLPSVGGFPVLLLAYPPFILMCIGLSLDALLLPAPSGRVMGDQARQRARPWLTGASLVLFLVSLLVGSSILWLLESARQRATIEELILTLSGVLSLVDLGLAALLMGSILLMGQAIISYEIFTGKTLPRRGFLLRWRITVLFAAALSMAAAWGVTAPFPQVYTVVGVLLLAAISYTLFNWQSFQERERSLGQLRPLATSQRLFDRMLTGAQTPQTDLSAPFGALCRDVLGAQQAMLLPLGPLAALGCPALHYPAGQPFDLPALAGLAGRFTSPQMTGLPLDPDEYGGAIWAAPLWNERGLIGLLFLGDKADGGIYAQEEIEIARSSGERLADIQASSQMAQRLMALQRQRMAESQVLDRQTRRILHDDVLPRLHAALLELSGPPAGEDAAGRVIGAISATHRQIADLLHDLPRVAAPEVSQLGLFGALRQVADSELRGAFDDVTWEIPAEAAQHAAGLPPVTAEVIFYAAREALRNAARHARPQDGSAAPALTVCAAWEDGLELVVQDNGAGLVPASTEGGGGGQGLTLHSTMMAVVGGTLALESTPAGTRVVLRLPGD